MPASHDSLALGGLCLTLTTFCVRDVQSPRWPGLSKTPFWSLRGIKQIEQSMRDLSDLWSESREIVDLLLPNMLQGVGKVNTRWSTGKKCPCIHTVKMIKNISSVQKRSHSR